MICWKIRIFAYWTTPKWNSGCAAPKLWFAEKFVSLLIEQHRWRSQGRRQRCCDLLKNSYLCLLNNTRWTTTSSSRPVVICWKIRIFAYWTTPRHLSRAAGFLLWFAEKFVSLLIEQHPYAHQQPPADWLWFAEKFVSLLIEQHPYAKRKAHAGRCDLLKNSYLCLLNNTETFQGYTYLLVVICWKIRIFAYWTTPDNQRWKDFKGCDLLKNSYLCLLNNTHESVETTAM